MANPVAGSLHAYPAAGPVSAIRPEPAPGGARPNPGEARLAAAARKFEAVFLAEMLRQAGFGRMPDSFNGGAGEAAFSGALIQEYATRIAESGGLGLAATIAAAEGAAGPATAEGAGR